MLALAPLALRAQAPGFVRVGRVTAVYWGRDGALAQALAEYADHTAGWPGLPGPARHPVRLLLARTTTRFDSLTSGRVPGWTGGVAFPGANTIVIRLDGDPRVALRHELAHLALHEYVGAVPRWFDEGYAARAANEWDRLDALRVNWALVKGEPPTLDSVSAALREGADQARDAYALATTAVVSLERLGGADGLAPLIRAMSGRARDLDQALRVAHGLTLDQFETRWQRDLKSRYGWMMYAGSVGVFWSVVGVVMLALWGVRRRRNAARRLALDQDPGFPVDSAGPTA
jgi:hypothetical protein